MIGRWNVVDALADHPNQIHLSPYAYGWNNPTNLTDPDGNCPACIIYATEALTYIAAATLAAVSTYMVVNTAKQVSNNGSFYSSAQDNTSVSKPKLQSIAKTENKDDHVEVGVSRSKHPESAEHLEEAIKNGVNNKGTIDRKGASERRREKLKGTKTEKGKDRDEVLPAVIDNDNFSIKHIGPSDNRGAGASIRHQIRNLPNGTKAKIIPKD